MTDPQARMAFTRVDRLFIEKNPGIEIDHVGYFDQEYIPALRASLLAGTGPDIIWLHGGAEFIEFQSYLCELDKYLVIDDLNLSRELLDSVSGEKGMLKALPLTVQGFGWYYNKELFVQAGLDPEKVPEDWNYFLKACQILKEQGIVPIAAGNNRPLTTEFIRRSLMAAFFYEEEIRCFYQGVEGVKSERFKTILLFIRELREKGYFHDEGIFRPYFNYAVDSFGKGEAAMIPGLLSDIGHWKNYSDALGADNIGYFPN